MERGAKEKEAKEKEVRGLPSIVYNKIWSKNRVFEYITNGLALGILITLIVMNKFSLENHSISVLANHLSVLYTVLILIKQISFYFNSVKRGGYGKTIKEYRFAITVTGMVISIVSMFHMMRDDSNHYSVKILLLSIPILVNGIFDLIYTKKREAYIVTTYVKIAVAAVVVFSDLVMKYKRVRIFLVLVPLITIYENVFSMKDSMSVNGINEDKKTLILGAALLALVIYMYFIKEVAYFPRFFRMATNQECTCE